MKDIISDLTSPTWWVTVIFATIVLNIVSNYVMRGLDRFLPKLAACFRAWFSRKTTEFDRESDQASKSIQTMTFLAARQGSLHIASLQNYLVGFGFFFISGRFSTLYYVHIASWAIGLIFIMFASADAGKAQRCRFTLEEAIKKNQSGAEKSTEVAKTN